MSALSFSLSIRTLDVDGNLIEHEVVDGQTYNLLPMWSMALPWWLEGTRDLDQRKCGDLLPDLEHGVIDIAMNEEAYRDLNPSNGWGDFDGFRRTFLRLTEMCRKYPSGWISWSG